MSMKIRLARGGSKKRPYYSIVATDSRMPRDGRFLVSAFMLVIAVVAATAAVRGWLP